MTRLAGALGDECKFGGGKVLRDGMGQRAGGLSTEADLATTTRFIEGEGEGGEGEGEGEGGKEGSDGEGEREGGGEEERTTEHRLELDVVITNIVVVDYTGIYKADIGIRFRRDGYEQEEEAGGGGGRRRGRRGGGGGRGVDQEEEEGGRRGWCSGTGENNLGFIAGIGKAGNPDMMAGVTPGMVIGARTGTSIVNVVVHHR